ncbi:hypothetical protein PS662_00300 [Pseudomonas fluorescens]|uniref:Uncharacterized protein n=1 Tax=Pseudomonas fluorescens TaxID=294 RepID=A0A5E6PDI7_PSEFL|nr:hypothetical protein PS662_00300 [Pseudomonas fluorescens]
MVWGLGVGGCVNIRYWVMADIGFALTASHLEEPQVTKGSCPTTRHLALARCALTPALLRGSPRRAVPGPARLNRHPCRFPRCAIPAFGQRGFMGRSGSKSKSKPRRPDSRPGGEFDQHHRRSHQCHGRQQSPVGASLLAMAIYHPTSMSADTPLSRASSLPQGICSAQRLCTVRSAKRARLMSM